MRHQYETSLFEGIFNKNVEIENSGVTSFFDFWRHNSKFC